MTTRFSTSIRGGIAGDTTVILRCEDMLARFWTLRAYYGRQNSPDTEGEPIKFLADNEQEAGSIRTEATMISLPSQVVQALADAFGDPDHRYESQVAELKAELSRAHDIIRALSDAVAGKVSQ